MTATKNACGDGESVQVMETWLVPGATLVIWGASSVLVASIEKVARRTTPPMVAVAVYVPDVAMAGLNTHHSARVGAIPEGWYRKIVSPAPPFHPAGPAMATLLMGPAGSVGSNRNPVPMSPPFLSLYVPPTMGMAGAVPNTTAVGTSRVVVVPSPRSPPSLAPRRYAA